MPPFRTQARARDRQARTAGGCVSTENEAIPTFHRRGGRPYCPVREISSVRGKTAFGDAGSEIGHQMPTIVARAHQTFPGLDEDQIASARGFAAAEERRFEPAEVIYRAGDKNVPAWLVLEGAIELSRHGGLGPDAPITSLGSGQFTGEVGQLSGRPALASASAGPDGCVALPFDAAHLRALIIGLAEIGEIVMRALILRRVALIEDGGSGTVLIGILAPAEMRKLQSSAEIRSSAPGAGLYG